MELKVVLDNQNKLTSSLFNENMFFHFRQFLFDSRCRRVNNNLLPIKLTL